MCRYIDACGRNAGFRCLLNIRLHGNGRPPRLARFRGACQPHKYNRNTLEAFVHDKANGEFPCGQERFQRSCAMAPTRARVRLLLAS